MDGEGEGRRKKQEKLLKNSINILAFNENCYSGYSTNGDFTYPYECQPSFLFLRVFLHRKFSSSQSYSNPFLHNKLHDLPVVTRERERERFL